MSGFSSLAEPWAHAFWTASWQGGLALLLAAVLAHRRLALPPRVVCWIWRLAYAKLLVALVWTSPLELPLLAPNPMGPKSVEGSDVATAPFQTVSESNADSILSNSAPVAPAKPRVSFTEAAFAVWLLGVAVVGGFTGAQAIGAQRHLSAADHASQELQRLLGEEAARAGVRTPELVVGATVTSPWLVGIWRPCVVLPHDVASRFTLQEIRLMLAHELAHVRRRDLAWNLLPAAARILFFCHPLAWWAARPWREAQELACDELVVASGIAPAESYGRLVLRLCSEPGAAQPGNLSLAGVAGRFAHFDRRLRAMFEIKPVSRLRLGVAATLLAVTGLLGLVPWRLVVAQQANEKLDDAEQERWNKEVRDAEARRTFYKAQSTRAKEVADTIQAVLALGGLVAIAPHSKEPEVVDPNKPVTDRIADDVLLPTDEITPEQALVIGATHKVIGIQLAGIEDHAVDLDFLEHASRLEGLIVQKATISEKGLSRLKDLPNLTGLNLVNSRLDRAGLVHLRELPKLRDLNLSGTNANDDDLALVGELDLESFHAPSATTDVGVAHLSKLSNLRHLWLWGTKISDRCIEQLKEMKKLEAVSLRETAVTPEAVERLRAARPDLLVGYKASTVEK